MHLFFLTRGIQQQVELFKMFIQTQMWKWERLNTKTGKKEIVQVQGGLRPIQLWEYIFPEDCYSEVMTALKMKDNKDIGTGDYWFNKARIFGLRKMLGAEKLPEFKPAVTNKFIETNGVTISPIGIKRDVKGKDPTGAPYEQEML